jgi:hypothetical protein
MAIRLIDLDTPRPNNHRGDPTRTANGITNDNMQEIGQRLESLENGTPAVDTRLDELDDAVVGLGASIAQEVEDRSAADSQLQQTINTAVDGIGLALEHRYGRNRLINGDLRIWQRRKSGRVGVGAGTLGSEAFCADRFTFSALSCTHDVSQGVVGNGQTTLPPQTSYAIIHTVSGASGSSAAWGGQRIEGVRSLQGKVTFSVQLNGTVGNKVGIRVIQNFGTGGAPSAEVATEVGVLTCTADPARKWITFTIPSTAGKTLGTNNNDFLYLVYDMCGTGYSGQIVGQNGQYAYSDFQFEAGTLTAFEWRSPALELALSQRFYEKSYDVGVAPGSGAVVGYESAAIVNGGYFLTASPRFQVAKRAVVSAITVYRYDTGATGQFTEYSQSGSPVAGRTASITGVGTQGFEVRGAGDAAAWNIARYHWTADSEF